jgi:hypothetical protein
MRSGAGIGTCRIRAVQPQHARAVHVVQRDKLARDIVRRTGWGELAGLELKWSLGGEESCRDAQQRAKNFGWKVHAFTEMSLPAKHAKDAKRKSVFASFACFAGCSRI